MSRETRQKPEPKVVSRGSISFHSLFLTSMATTVNNDDDHTQHSLDNSLLLQQHMK